MKNFSSTYMSKTQIAVRFLSPLAPGSTIVLGIPGGPGIDGHYMNEPVKQLAESLHLNGAVIDLPNHGQSGRRSDKDTKFMYPEARTMLISFLNELSDRGIKFVFYGHSLGALIGMDLLRATSAQVEAALFVSVPTSFESHPDFDVFLKDVNAEESSWPRESDFELWWRKIIPAYFTRSLTPTEMRILSTPTHWIGNENFNDSMPAFADIAADLVRQQKVSRIVYFEGEKELVLPIDNFALVQRSLPGITAYRMNGTGHFPMLDNANFIQQKFSTGGFRCSSLFSGL